jgi:nucleotide-binding universal stress UspA family protein
MNSPVHNSVSSANTQLIKKILVPVDYSECSTFASRYAVKIACKVGAEIRFFHTYYSPAFDLIELAGAVQTQAQLREEVTNNLEESERATAESFIQRMRDYVKECGIQSSGFSYEIAPGVPEDEIIRYSEDYLPDLVVMGTHGKGTGVSAIMGSVTASVINRISLPIMAIPEKYTFVGEKNVKNVLYVTDFDESDFLSLRKLMNLTEQLDLDIHCVHIGDNTRAWDQVKMDGLMEYFKKAYGKTQVTYSFVQPKNLLEDLDRLIKDRNINIISLTSHRRNIIDKLFRPSITKKLFYHTSIPLLVFHPAPRG